MGSEIKRVAGFRSRGGEKPYLNPMEVGIAGLTHGDGVEGDPAATDLNWFAHDPRVNEDLEDAFVANVAANNVERPIDVYMDGNRAIVLEGRRRLRAARRLWLAQEKEGVPEDDRVAVCVIIRKGTDEELFRYNVGSDDPGLRKNRNPIQRAAMISMYVKRMSDDVDKAAAFFECSAGTIRNALALLNLAGPVQAEVAAGALSQNNGVRLALLPRAEQVTALADFKAATKDSAKALKEAAVEPEETKEGKVKKPKAKAAKIARQRIVTEDSVRSRRELLKIREALGELEVGKDLEEARNHIAAALAWTTNSRIGNSDVSKVFALAEKAAEKPKKAKRA